MAGRRRPRRPNDSPRRRRALQRRQLGGSNLGPTNKALIDRVKGDVEALQGGEPGRAGAGRPGHRLGQRPRSAHHAGRRAVQVPRVAKARGLPEARCGQLVDRAHEGRTLGFLGEPRVNVLQLNLALDALAAR